MSGSLSLKSLMRYPRARESVCVCVCILWSSYVPFFYPVASIFIFFKTELKQRQHKQRQYHSERLLVLTYE